MKNIITWISIIIVATIVSSCEESYENHKSSCHLSMCIDAPSLNLNNRQYVAICDRDIRRTVYHKTLLAIQPSEQYFEFSMGTHLLGPKRGNGPEAEFYFSILQKKYPLEINKKYLLETSGDFMTSNYYCGTDVKLLIDGEWYLSNDGWFKITDILLANGEKYYPKHNSSISEIKCEFEFTAVKEGEEDGEKLVVRNGSFAVRT
ncbi:MAG: hypothetical protein J6U59_03115 [Alistipes sp.]|nr:hypothetical protein [Alistipes sp.]